MNKTYSVHAPLTTQTVWVNKGIFFNMEKETDKWEKVKLFGITCLPGQVPLFEIITPEGYVFSDVPPHLVKWKETMEKEYSLTSLVYNNCLSEDFSLSYFPELESRTAFVFFKEENQYLKAKYIFSLDFYKNNNWYHCLKLDNGQFCFIPSHKIIFSEKENLDPTKVGFPQFKKLRQKYSV